MNFPLTTNTLQPPLDIKRLDFTWMITGILYHGGSERLLENLYRRGINEAYFCNVSGAAIGRHIIAGGLGESFDVESFNVVVAADQADTLFEEIYEFCEMYLPNKGMLQMQRLGWSTTNVMTDVAAALQAH